MAPGPSAAAPSRRAWCRPADRSSPTTNWLDTQIFLVLTTQRGAGGPWGAEGGVIFFFLFIVHMVFHPFPWILAPVPLDSPIGGLKKKVKLQKKVQKRKMKQKTNS